MKIEENYLVAPVTTMVEFCIIEEKEEFICVPQITRGTGDMAQQLRALTALPRAGAWF